MSAYRLPPTAYRLPPGCRSTRASPLRRHYIAGDARTLTDEALHDQNRVTLDNRLLINLSSVAQEYT